MIAMPRSMLGLWACALLMGAGCATAPEQGAPSREQAMPQPASPHAELEAIFWACDYVATTRGIDATPAAQCAAATRELRRVKFANSFQAMLAWWRENKPVEHDRQRRARSEHPL